MSSSVLVLLLCSILASLVSRTRRRLFLLAPGLFASVAVFPSLARGLPLFGLLRFLLLLLACLVLSFWLFGYG